MPESEEPEYAIEGRDTEQPYEKAIKPAPVAAAPKKHHHHHKTAKPAVSEEDEDEDDKKETEKKEVKPVPKAAHEEQPRTPLQKQ
jgi:hypothetical protein